MNPNTLQLPGNGGSAMPTGVNNLTDPTTAGLLNSLYPTARPQTQQVQTTPQQPTDSGNWFTKLFPTIGGILGGIGGTIVSPFAGSVTGAGLGGGLGKEIENLVEGKSATDLGSVAESALENTAGQATGYGLGKLGGGLLGKLFGGANNMVANTAAKQGEADAANALAQEFPDKALTPKVKTNLNFGQSLDLADKAGIPKTAQGFAGAAGVGTGASGYLNGTLDNLVRGAGDVNLSDFGKTVEDAIKANPELGSLEAVSGVRGGLPKPEANIANTTRNQFSDLLQNVGLGGQGGGITSGTTPGGMTVPRLSLGNAQPDNALDLLRKVGQLGQKYAGSLPGTPGAAQANVYNKVYQALKNTIYNRPEVVDAVKGFQAAPEDLTALTKASGGNQQFAQHLIDIVNNASHPNDILTPQAQLIKMGQAGQKALDYNTNVVGTSADAKAAAQAAGTAAQPMDTAAQIATHGLLSKLGLPVAGVGAMTGNPMLMAAAIPALLQSQAAKGVGSNILSKFTDAGLQKNVAKAASPVLTAASQFVANSPNYTSNPASSAQGANAMMPAGMGAMPPMNNPNSQALLQANIGLQDPYLASTFAPIVNSLLTGPGQKANSANSALQSAESAYNLAGGGQGLLGGLFSKLGGMVTGGPAATYDAQKQQLASQLMAMGIPASAIPDITNTTPAAQSQWQALQSLINSMSTAGGQAPMGGMGGSSLLAGI